MADGGWPAGARRSGVARSACREPAALERHPTREVGGVEEPGRGGMQQRETIVATNQTSTTPEGGATAGMAKW